jgi:hypothetical protein
MAYSLENTNDLIALADTVREKTSTTATLTIP